MRYINSIEIQMITNADDYFTVHSYRGLAKFCFEKLRVP